MLLDVVQILTDLDLSIPKAYISSDGVWFMDGEHALPTCLHACAVASVGATFFLLPLLPALAVTVALTFSPFSLSRLQFFMSQRLTARRSWMRA